MENIVEYIMLILFVVYIVFNNKPKHSGGVGHFPIDGKRPNDKLPKYFRDE